MTRARIGCAPPIATTTSGWRRSSANTTRTISSTSIRTSSRRANRPVATAWECIASGQLSLSGHGSLTRLGRFDEAAEVEAQFAEAWAYADVELTASRF